MSALSKIEIQTVNTYLSVSEILFHIISHEGAGLEPQVLHKGPYAKAVTMYYVATLGLIHAINTMGIQ